MNISRVASTTVFSSLADLLKVHGHQGRIVAEPYLYENRIQHLEKRFDVAEQGFEGR